MTDAVAARADHSRFVQRIRRRYGAELELLAAGVPGQASMAALVRTLMDAGRPLASALRVARQLVLERLAVCDVEQGLSMTEVTEAMTDRDRMRHRMVLAELERLGWTHGSEVPPVIATSTIVDGRVLGGIIAVADLTTVEVWNADDTELPVGITLREHDPVVRTAPHPTLARVVSATVVDLTEVPAVNAGTTVVRALAATTTAHLAALTACGDDAPS